MMTMGDIQFSQIMQLCALVLILVGAYNTIMSAIKNRREEKKLRDSPVTQLTERVDMHDTLLEKDKDRLDTLEADGVDVHEAIRILLRQAMAINNHIISGNDVSKLRESSSEIQKYLLNRR